MTLRAPSSSMKKMDKIYTYPGVLNAGILQLPWIMGGPPTQYGGQFIFRHTDLPIFNAFASNYEFVRVNSFVMEFSPRYNQTTNPGTTGGSTLTPSLQDYNLQTFITALDEVPIQGSSGAYITATQTWLSQADEDAGVTEMFPAANPNITPDYMRGLATSQETELYKRHVIRFTPSFFVQAQEFSTASMDGNDFAQGYELRRKRWLPTNLYNQATSTKEILSGPTYHGPLYSFTSLSESTVPTVATHVYDIKVRYSVSFKRLRGV